jgi:hypothetical protein
LQHPFFKVKRKIGNILPSGDQRKYGPCWKTHNSSIINVIDPISRAYIAVACEGDSTKHSTILTEQSAMKGRTFSTHVIYDATAASDRDQIERVKKDLEVMPQFLL